MVFPVTRTTRSFSSPLTSGQTLKRKILSQTLASKWVMCQFRRYFSEILPFQPWLMKPYTNAALTPEERYFNYRLSRTRMVTEGAYGQLKGRWRVLLRKCESSTEVIKVMTLACMVLHNICIDREDTMCKQLDLTLDPLTNEGGDRDTIRKLLKMRSCPKTRDSCGQARNIRNSLCDKLWKEKLRL